MCLEHMIIQMTKCTYIATKEDNKTVYRFSKKSRKKYDKNIQNIFLILDNLSVHQSKKVKEVIAKYCPRI